jgi:hypothetical protein
MRARLGKFIDIQRWVDFVAEEGSEVEAFQTVGRWRKGETMDHAAPVYLPYIHLDIDRGSFPEAHEDAVEILSYMEEFPFDYDRVALSFSGSKGFHISIHTSQIASPIFENGRTARYFVSAFTKLITGGIPTDPALCSPYQLIRLTNSKHIKTGLYKNTVRSTGTDVTLSSTEFYPWRDSDLIGPPISDLAPLVKQAMQDADKLASRHIDAEQRIQNGEGLPGRIGPIIGALLDGVKESENWHQLHAGRNSAAFILACFLLEGEARQKAIAKAIQYVPELPFGEIETAYEILTAWNLRNEPPYSDAELRNPFASATKVVGRNG